MHSEFRGYRLGKLQLGGNSPPPSRRGRIRSLARPAVGTVQRAHVGNELAQFCFVEFTAADRAEKRGQGREHAFGGRDVGREFAPRERGLIEKLLARLAVQPEHTGDGLERRFVAGWRVHATLDLAPIAGIDARLRAKLAEREFTGDAQVFGQIGETHGGVFSFEKEGSFDNSVVW